MYGAHSLFYNVSILPNHSFWWHPALQLHSYRWRLERHRLSSSHKRRRHSCTRRGTRRRVLFSSGRRQRLHWPVLRHTRDRICARGAAQRFILHFPQPHFILGPIDVPYGLECSRSADSRCGRTFGDLIRRASERTGYSSRGSGARHIPRGGAPHSRSRPHEGLWSRDKSRATLRTMPNDNILDSGKVRS